MVLSVSTIISKKCFSQAPATDSIPQQAALTNAVNFYNTTLGDQSPLYTGPEYFFYDPIIKGNAYFADVNSFTPGSVYYDGVLYSGVPMLYDIYSDKVVALLYNHFSKFVLLKERVKSFDISSHHFIHVVVDTTGVKKPEIKSGYYDELYNGKTQVLVKRMKSIQTNTGGLTGSESYFNPGKDLFLKKDDAYYAISGQGALIDALKDRKKELQQYIKANKIKFRKTPEEAMVKIASYYDHLTN